MNLYQAALPLTSGISTSLEGNDILVWLIDTSRVSFEDSYLFYSSIVEKANEYL